MEPEEEDGGRYGTVENPRIPEDEIARPRRARRLEVPPLREQLLRCLAACGEMFGTSLEGSHYERDATLRWRGSEAAASARGSIDVTLHQLELVTRGLCDGRLEPAQERLLLAGSNEPDPRILL